MQNKLPKIKETSEKIKEEVRSKTVGYILTAFGLVAGLSWNDAITTLINHLFPFGKNSVVAKFVYAFLITTVVVMIGVYMSRFLRQGESKKRK